MGNVLFDAKGRHPSIPVLPPLSDRGRLLFMASQQQIDSRSLALARMVASRIDADPEHRAIDRARAYCARWRQTAPCADLDVWAGLLHRPWQDIRDVLLDPSERGARLRQSNPFCGVLSPRERWAFYRSFCHDSRAA